jgi:hypothetical protein
MRKKITKHIVLIATFLMASAITGCGTMMFLFGDNVRYSLSGKVQDASAPYDKGIQGVTVAVDCPGLEKRIYQNSKGVTDANGNYELTGYWELQGCEIRFTHNKYSPQTIDIDERHLVQSKGLVRAYKVDVRLDSK